MNEACREKAMQKYALYMQGEGDRSNTPFIHVTFASAAVDTPTGAMVKGGGDMIVERAFDYEVLSEDTVLVMYLPTGRTKPTYAELVYLEEFYTKRAYCLLGRSDSALRRGNVKFAKRLANEASRAISERIWCDVRIKEYSK